MLVLRADVLFQGRCRVGVTQVRLFALVGGSVFWLAFSWSYKCSYPTADCYILETFCLSSLILLGAGN